MCMYHQSNCHPPPIRVKAVFGFLLKALQSNHCLLLLLQEHVVLHSKKFKNMLFCTKEVQKYVVLHSKKFRNMLLCAARSSGTCCSAQQEVQKYVALHSNKFGSKPHTQ